MPKLPQLDKREMSRRMKELCLRHIKGKYSTEQVLHIMALMEIAYIAGWNDGQFVALDYAQNLFQGR
jgi:hypothetical protein